MGGGVQNPTARVEYALRADEALSEAQVRQVMEYYLAVRMRRIGSAFSNDQNHLQRVEASRSDSRGLSSTGHNPIVPRPALVAGGGRVAVDARTPITPRLRPIRSNERY
jgi:hypothetical protein